MEKIGLKLFGATMLLGVLLFVFMFIVIDSQNKNNEQSIPLAHFSDYNELVTYLGKAQSDYSPYYRGGILGDGVVNAGAEKSAASPTSGSGAQATDYSKTNIQVEGVDEADIVKNDGKYVYAISNNSIFIINAYPADEMKIISQVDFNSQLTPLELFIFEDKLVLFANQNNYSPEIYYSEREEKARVASFSIMRMPYYYGSGSVDVFVYDISDKSNPTLKKELSFEGSYVSSRLIGENAYFVINSYPKYDCAKEDDLCVIPMMGNDGVESKIADVSEIGIVPRVTPKSFVTIASVNLSNLDLEKETILASTDNIYSSQNNLYLADTYWDGYNSSGILPYEIEAFVKSIYYPNISTTQKTIVNKFSLNDGKVSFRGQGIVPGTILNQFSMDEYNNNFRIATTVENYSDSISTSRSNNNLYVLNEDMNLVGSIEGIAPDEKIYSVRFMGDRGYMVTFKYVDPLFVIDLSDAKDPKILGKLKIPGYSDYMHPIDETHLLGIGKDANELEDFEKVHSQGAVYYTAIKGVKMAIFDVSDVENPKEVSKYVIGDRGTDSEALTNHKAILFDKEKELLVLPITVVENNTPNTDYYGTEQTFQGAVVMNVSLENGLSERGRITHVTSEEEMKRGYYYGSESVIRRSLFMDNVLYTLSSKVLKANNLSDLSEVNKIELPFVGSSSYRYGYPMMID
jgi:uncharacterized secreted protein with C-terminal beta-propeller domain